jgi:hypothetical protein
MFEISKVGDLETLFNETLTDPETITDIKFTASVCSKGTEDGCSNYGTLDFTKFTFLKTLTAEEGITGFMNSTDIVLISGLNYLESINFGMSFAARGNTKSTASISGSKLEITDCPILTEIKMGSNSFLGYESFSISNLPSLETIEFLDDNYSTSNFKFVSSVTFEDLAALKSLTIGSNAFYYTTSVTLKNLPSLVHLEIKVAFSSDGYIFTIDNVKSGVTFINTSSFQSYGKIFVYNTPEMTLQFDKVTFKNTIVIEGDDISSRVVEALKKFIASSSSTDTNASN